MNYTEYIHKVSEKYRSYMSSPEWSKKRDEVFLEKGRACEKCKSEYNLSVHHSSYRFLGFEPIGYLFVLCDKCHYEFHKKYNLGESMLRKTLNFIFGKNSKAKKEYIEKYNL